MASLALPLANIGSSLLSGYLGSRGVNKAADYLSNAANNATGNIEQATGNAQNAVNNALNTNAGNVNTAAGNASAGVNAATGTANGLLGQYLSNSSQTLYPYLQTGNTAANGLNSYIGSNPQFNFNLQDYLNSPAMNFQMQEGTNAINNSASATGLADSGNTLKALTQFGQGLASTYYNNAFNQAQQQFQTNDQSTLQRLGMGLNTGQNAASQYMGAQGMFGVPQGTNDINAALYGGNTGLGAATFNAGQNLSGQEYAGNIGLTGNNLAMQYMMGGAQAQAAGALGNANSLSNMFTGIGSQIPGLMNYLNLGGSGGNTNNLPIASSSNPWNPIIAG